MREGESRIDFESGGVAESSEAVERERFMTTLIGRGASSTLTATGETGETGVSGCQIEQVSQSTRSTPTEVLTLQLLGLSSRSQDFLNDRQRILGQKRAGEHGESFQVGQRDRSHHRFAHARLF